MRPPSEPRCLRDRSCLQVRERRCSRCSEASVAAPPRRHHRGEGVTHPQHCTRRSWVKSWTRAHAEKVEWPAHTWEAPCASAGRGVQDEDTEAGSAESESHAHAEVHVHARIREARSVLGLVLGEGRMVRRLATRGASITDSRDSRASARAAVEVGYGRRWVPVRGAAPNARRAPRTDVESESGRSDRTSPRRESAACGRVLHAAAVTVLRS